MRIKPGDLWKEEQVRQKLKELLLNCKSKGHCLQEYSQIFAKPEELNIRWGKKFRSVSIRRFGETELIYVEVHL